MAIGGSRCSGCWLPPCLDGCVSQLGRGGPSMGGIFAFTTRSPKDRSNPGGRNPDDSDRGQVVGEVEQCSMSSNGNRTGINLWTKRPVDRMLLKDPNRRVHYHAFLPCQCCQISMNLHFDLNPLRRILDVRERPCRPDSCSDPPWHPLYEGRDASVVETTYGGFISPPFRIMSVVPPA